MDSLKQFDTTIAALRGEIDSIFAAQIIEPSMVANMESQYFYFIAILVFTLLGFILVERILFNKTLISFKKDVKDLARMKGDMVKLATLLQTAVGNQNRIRARSNGRETSGNTRPFNSTDTQMMVPAKEWRRLKSLEGVYLDSAANMIARKPDTNLLDEG